MNIIVYILKYINLTPLKYIPIYYIFLLVIYILFNNKNIYYNDKLLVNYLYILKKKLKDETFRKICNGLSQKFDTKNFYNIFIKNIDE